MLVNNYVTPANVQYVGNSVEATVDYIFEKIEELEDKDE